MVYGPILFHLRLKFALIFYNHYDLTVPHLLVCLKKLLQRLLFIRTNTIYTTKVGRDNGPPPVTILTHIAALIWIIAVRPICRLRVFST